MSDSGHDLPQQRPMVAATNEPRGMGEAFIATRKPGLREHVTLIASLCVLGAVCGFPSVAADFPANWFLFGLPAAVALLIPFVHESEEKRPTAGLLLLETAATFAGFAIAFHTYHGECDYQGVIIGLIGTLIFWPINLYGTARVCV